MRICTYVPVLIGSAHHSDSYPLPRSSHHIYLSDSILSNAVGGSTPSFVSLLAATHSPIRDTAQPRPLTDALAPLIIIATSACPTSPISLVATTQPVPRRPVSSVNQRALALSPRYRLTPPLPSTRTFRGYRHSTRYACLRVFDSACENLVVCFLLLFIVFFFEHLYRLFI